MSDNFSPPPMIEDRPLRFVWFGESIVSDLGNPAATTSRSLLRALDRLGHHAVFLEERGNRPTTALLRTHGGAPLRAFNREFPDIAYRTYELPAGRERFVWLGRELSVADVVVIQDTTPESVLDLIRHGTPPHIVRIAQLTTESVPSFDADLVVAPIDSDAGQPLGPAIWTGGLIHPPRQNGVIVVAYGDLPLATALVKRLAPLAPALVSAGPPAAPGIPYVPEAELRARYADYDAVVVVAVGAQPLAAARALLPLSMGCVTFIAGTFPAAPTATALGVEPVSEETAFGRVTQGIEATSKGITPRLPPRFDAAVQVDQLVSELRTIKLTARSGISGVNKDHE